MRAYKNIQGGVANHHSGEVDGRGEQASYATVVEYYAACNACSSWSSSGTYTLQGCADYCASSPFFTHATDGDSKCKCCTACDKPIADNKWGMIAYSTRQAQGVSLAQQNDECPEAAALAKELKKLESSICSSGTSLFRQSRVERNGDEVEQWEYAQQGNEIAQWLLS